MMKVAAVTLFLALLSVAAAMPEHLIFRPEVELDVEAEHWGVLVAGSNGWDNYRHQADICHAYQILHTNGVPDDHIIVFMYDDIAYSPENPMQGKVINKPEGPNVYPGVLKNYTGEDVTPENFLAVLKGDSSAITLTEKNSTGGVLRSGPNDHVFVYFADHGAPDLIAFPDGELMATDLLAALHTMFHSQMYSKLVFFVEACESGSMFQQLPKNMNIYATTAAGPDESSWGWYCDNPQLDTCLGDEYSVRWMEDADKEDLTAETLQSEFKLVKKEVTKSTPHKYGDMNFVKDTMAEYIGKQQGANTVEWTAIGGETAESLSIPSPEMKLALLQRRLMKTGNSPSARDLVLQDIITEAENQRSMIGKMKLITALAAGSDGVDEYMERPETLVIQDKQCYKTAVKYFSQKCVSLGKNEYALRLVFTFAKLCDDGISADSIISAMDLTCQTRM